MTLSYFSTTRATALSAAATSGATDLYVTDGGTFPDPAVNGEYKVIVGYGSEREEVCIVTAKPATNTLHVTRAQDSTAATSKNIGDVVVHGVSAEEFRDAAAHMAATTNVHGVTGYPVGSWGWDTTIPVVKQGATTVSINNSQPCEWVKLTPGSGGVIVYEGYVQVTGAGGSGMLTISLPATGAMSYMGAGQVAFYDASAGTYTTYLAAVSGAPQTKVEVLGMNTALASGDALYFSLTYHAAA